jgi:UDP-N-acetyl-D-mannosaminuronic acid dehydrogenase
LADAEAVVLLVDHAQFRALDPHLAAGLMPGRVAIDLRGVWEREKWRDAGFALHILGVGREDA